MHRQTDYAFQVPSETDFLYAQRFAYEALGLLAADLLGTSALVSGLACTPTGPASLNVQIAPGRIYSFQNLDPTAWGLFNSIGGLNADTDADHDILKQGLFRDTTTFACAAPSTVGDSINYLIEASFSEVDALPISLPFVSATAPYPPIAPNTLDTVRQDLCVITVKAGVPAPTGTQTTPAPDSGNVGLWVVTVAQGQTTITSGNISKYGSAPFITETLTQKISQTTGDARYAPIAILQALTGAAGGSGWFRIPGTPYIFQWASYSITPGNSTNTPAGTLWGNATITFPVSSPPNNQLFAYGFGPGTTTNGQFNSDSASMGSGSGVIYVTTWGSGVTYPMVGMVWQIVS